MRPIDADVLKQHIDKLPALPDGNFAGNHSALKALINMQPTIQPVATDINVGSCSEIPNSWDCISRQAAIDALDCINGAEEVLRSLPSVQPEPQWIPVEKELPEPRIDVWVNSDLGQMVGYYDDMVNLWYGRDYLELIVNAWMPLPEAYKPNK